jgi:hypothetical protein
MGVTNEVLLLTGTEPSDEAGAMGVKNGVSCFSAAILPFKSATLLVKGEFKGPVGPGLNRALFISGSQTYPSNYLNFAVFCSLIIKARLSAAPEHDFSLTASRHGRSFSNEIDYSTEMATAPAETPADGSALRQRHPSSQTPPIPSIPSPPSPSSPPPPATSWRMDAQNIFVLVVLYALQGIPLGLVMGSLPFLLQAQISAAPTPPPSADGSSIGTYTTLGIFSLAAYPYSLKLLWSPFVDTFYFPST